MRRSTAQLLRERNKELKAALAIIGRFRLPPTYPLSFLRQAVAEVEGKGRLGDTCYLYKPEQFNPQATGIIDAPREIILVIKDV